MAKNSNIHRYLLGIYLSCCLVAYQPAVAQDHTNFGPKRSQLFQPPPPPIRDLVATIYEAEVGTLEIGKNNHGPGPKKYLASCGLDEGFAYCACFVKYCLTQAGIPTKGGTAWSPSWFPSTKLIWKQGKVQPRLVSPRTEIIQPQQGDVFGLYFQKLGRIGHVGFIHQWGGPRADDWVYTVEGNTNGEGSREGDGVHARRRLKRQIHFVSNWIDP